MFNKINIKDFSFQMYFSTSIIMLFWIILYMLTYNLKQYWHYFLHFLQKNYLIIFSISFIFLFLLFWKIKYNITKNITNIDDFNSYFYFLNFNNLIILFSLMIDFSMYKILWIIILYFSFFILWFFTYQNNTNLNKKMMNVTLFINILICIMYFLIYWLFKYETNKIL